MKRLVQAWRRKSERGVTLPELLVVLVIIGILASVAIPSYSNYLNRNKLADAVSNLQDLRLRMEQYYQDNRTYQSAGNCAIAMPTLKEFTLTCTTTAKRNFSIVAKNKADAGLGSAGAYEYSINQDGQMATVKFDGETVNLTCLRVGPSC